MEFQVVAITVDVTAEPCRFGAIRTENVDTRNPDSPFAGCSTIQDVEFAYERYWNYRNDPDVVQNPAAKVKVLSVNPVFAA
ncbi:MAG TPA: hypothetical protein VIM12_17995 [Noviherbaspirillum sp.]|jgi:hypothetical protein|uniref:hypothetical protein n=1 Tax=Noviherbaspirillum sp. TaxID=1926288 RepID=UPI002F94BF01